MDTHATVADAQPSSGAAAADTGVSSALIAAAAEHRITFGLPERAPDPPRDVSLDVVLDDRLQRLAGTAVEVATGIVFHDDPAHVAAVQRIAPGDRYFTVYVDPHADGGFAVGGEQVTEDDLAQLVKANRAFQNSELPLRLACSGAGLDGDRGHAFQRAVDEPVTVTDHTVFVDVLDFGHHQVTGPEHDYRFVLDTGTAVQYPGGGISIEPVHDAWFTLPRL